MQKLCLFVFLFYSQALCSEYSWRIEHKNGSLIWLEEEPFLSADNIQFQLDQKKVTLLLLDVVSLKHYPQVKKHWLYHDPKKESSLQSPSSTVVRIKNKTHRGSGVMIHPAGYILTNHHLIESNHDIQVIHENNKTYQATVFAISQLFDLAILKLNDTNETTFHFSKIGDDTSLYQDEALFSFSTSNSTEWRKVTGTLKKDYEYFGAEDGIIYQQIHLTLEPDNSGSPLFNEKGELVGILTKHLKSAQIKGGWFSIPSGFLKIFLQSINGFIHDPTQRPIEYLPFGE